MIRTVIAGLVFTLLYGVALRLYLYQRATRDAHRWHWRAAGAAALAGGVAFYIAQQIRMPHRPGLLDIPAFAIMVVAASSIPVLLELGRVLQARVLRDTRLQVPHNRRVDVDPPPSAAGTPTDSAERN